MHRHGYKGRKFGRERDQRRALLKGLADSLIQYESIETTISKAKELVPYMERLITKAKVGDLHNRRLIIASVSTIENAHKLVDEIAPKLQGRVSGHLRIQRTVLRKGDNTQMAQVTFVDSLQDSPTKPEVKATESEKTVKPAKKAPAKKKEIVS